MKRILLCAGLVLAAAPIAAASTWFVDKASSSSTENGTQWATAFKTVQAAIDAASAGDEIWVAAATYDETRADSTGALLLKAGVALYGGFTGAEASRDARDWSAHATIISGTAARSGSAAYHVVLGADDAVLDGFTITGGCASDAADEAKGGGMYNRFASPVVAHCLFDGNQAAVAGGGIHNHQSSPVFHQCTIRNNTAPTGAGMCNQTSFPSVLNCTFSTNTATGSGGAVSNHGACTLLFQGCTIAGNAAADGAGIENTDACTPTYIRCTFDGNIASNEGGAMANRFGATVKAAYCVFANNQALEGAAVSDNTCVSTYSDCTFTLNTATAGAGGALLLTDTWPEVVRSVFKVNTAVYGGAICALNTPAVFQNNVFWANTASNGSGGALYLDGAVTILLANSSFSVNSASNGGTGGAVYLTSAVSGTFYNDIFYGDSPGEVSGAAPTIIYSDVQGGFTGTGNIQTDPSFRDAATGDLAILSASLCIDKGSSANAPACDILGTPRPQPTGGTYDMGAYEYGTAAPVADASAAPTTGTVPLTVAFADLSLPGTGTSATWLWDFGDGTTSTLQHPEHTYTRGGTYTVSLAITTSDGTATWLQTACVAAAGGPAAGFTASPATGTPPLAVQFTDTSTAGRSTITTWAWDFGDGTTATSPSPAHTYTAAGVYTVTLTVDSETGASTKSAIINVGGPTAAFTAGATIAYAATTVQFTNESEAGTSPITEYLWDFGDGTTSTLENPAHTYTTPGFYTVSLTVSSAVGATTETKPGYIRIYRRFYVDAASTASNPDGTSWASAYTAIQEGIDAAHAAGAPGEIWVAAGTYSETRDNATGSVILQPGIALYGGFNKAETARAQRDPTANETLIDGSAARAGASAYHVILGADDAILDGFTITGGAADDGIANNGAPEDTGGGMLNYWASPTVAHCIFTGNRAIEGGGVMNVHAAPVISSCTFSSNTGDLDGGGLHNYFGGATVADCVFTLNAATPYGGAVYNEKTTSHFLRCVFTGNTADYGAAMLNYYADSQSEDCIFAANQGAYGGAVYNEHAAPRYTRCAFTGNTVPAQGGLGGAMFNITFAAPVISSCTFTENTAEAGAALYNYDRSAPLLTNALLTGNIATAAAGGLFNGQSHSSLVNCTLAGNEAPQGTAMFNYLCTTPTAILNGIVWNEEATQEIADIGGTATLATYSDIHTSGVYTGTGNINEDPAFADTTAGCHLTAASPCVDTATSTGAPSIDLAGTPRPQGSAFDIGAYEYTVWPAASFDADTTTGPPPLAIQFTDQSTPGTSPITAWLWDFGDGSTHGTEANPAHTYSASGKYTVTLTVTTSAGSSTHTETEYIHVSSGPTADFSANPATGIAPLDVAFTDTSVAGPSPITAYVWDFGDGTTSTLQNPSHTFAAGTYTLSLTVTAQDGQYDTRTRTAYIVADTAPTASFDAAPVSGYAPLAVQFTDTSAPGTQPITQWAWDFGDGAASTAQNPSHTYTSAGSFTVALTVTTLVASNTYTQTAAVVVQAGIAPAAAFTGTPSSGTRPLTVQFTDGSTSGTSPITQWQWSFGDGTTSTEQNPVHSFDEAGDFTVALTVTSAVGIATESKTDYIHVDPSVAPNAAFTATPVSGFRPLTVQFIDASTEGTKVITHWTWDFGDGETSTLASPSHTYTDTGDFTVSLTVQNPVGSDTETKSAYIHVGTLVLVDKDNTSGTQDGTTWATAYREIQDGIDSAVTLGGAEVWVAEGTYDEARSSGSGAVTMAGQVYLYGGFAGTETARADRDWNTHKTIIDGTEARRGSPAYHVVVGADNAILDGFTITGGNATGTGNGRDRGAGLYNNGVSPSVAHCTFTGLSANYGGAAMYNESNAPSVYSCLMTGNTAAGSTFSAGRGGAICNQSATPSIMNCIFSGNTAAASFLSAAQGGAIYNSGGSPAIINCTFYENACAAANTPGKGGAILNSQTSPSITNCVLWQDSPDEINDQDGASPQIQYCDVQGGVSSGTGNIESDPLFTNPTTGDLTLNATSPCVDHGLGTAAPAEDYLGVPRPQGTAVDIGAYECSAPPTAAFEATPVTGYAPLNVVFTDTSAPGTSPIVSWAWNFGDGASSSTQHPTHRYATEGTYTVSLTVATAVGTDTQTQSTLIIVSPGIAPTAEFTADPITGNAPLTVHFTDTSTAGSAPITAWEWNFGDGETSTEQSPTHTYDTPGVYSVSLTLTSDSGSPTKNATDTITVTVAPALPIAAGPAGITALLLLLSFIAVRPPRIVSRKTPPKAVTQPPAR